MWFDSTALTPWVIDPTKSAITDKVGFVPPPSDQPVLMEFWLDGTLVSPVMLMRNDEAAWRSSFG